MITESPAGADKAVVLVVSADADDNAITKLEIVAGTFATGNFLDGTIAKQISAYGVPETTFNAQSGLSLDPIYNFDEYDNAGEPTKLQKIYIDTPNVFLQTDIIY